MLSLTCVLLLGGECGVTPDALAAAQAVPPPDLRDFPAAQAPDGLALVQLPDTIGAVADVFKRLPAQVAGHAREPQFQHISSERAAVGYGQDARTPGLQTPLLHLQAVNLAIPNFFPPNWTGGQVVAYMAGLGKETMDAGRDGALFWMRMRNQTSPSAPGSAEQVVLHGILWGRVDSPWLFSAPADTPEHRDDLLRAFLAAAVLTGK
jgi:hypothetical protein